MKKLLILLISVIFLLITGCDILNTDDDTTPYGNLKISGEVYMDNAPVADAVIQIDDVNNWKVNTDGTGRFEIFRVSGGEHEIKIEKSLGDGRVVGQRTKIFLSEQAKDLGSFVLPAGANMAPIDPALVTSNSIVLKWDSTVDPDFVEYRIYRDTSPDVNELSSELIYTTSSIGENEYLDINFRTGVPIYYRVYAFSTFGRYAGSKIESASTAAYNLVKNTGFEETSNGVLPNNWVERIAGLPLFKFFAYSQEDKYSGQSSAKITYIESQANPDPENGSWGGIYQHVFTDNMNFNQTYTLSFWLKMNSGSVQMRVMKNGDFTQPLLYAQLPSTGQWQQHHINFNIDKDTRFIEIWMNTKSELAEIGLVNGFIDEITIIK